MLWKKYHYLYIRQRYHGAKLPLLALDIKCLQGLEPFNRARKYFSLSTKVLASTVHPSSNPSNSTSHVDFFLTASESKGEKLVNTIHVTHLQCRNNIYKTHRGMFPMGSIAPARVQRQPCMPFPSPLCSTGRQFSMATAVTNFYSIKSASFNSHVTVPVQWFA